MLERTVTLAEVGKVVDATVAALLGPAAPGASSAPPPKPSLPGPPPRPSAGSGVSSVFVEQLEHTCRGSAQFNLPLAGATSLFFGLQLTGKLSITP